MTLEELLNEWDKDTHIDPSQLGDAAIKIARLHQKWLRHSAHESLRLKKVEAELKQLRLEKYEFYTQGETSETRAKGWVFPSRGTVLVKDVPLYMEADTHIIEKNLIVAYHAEIVKTIEYIMKALQNRNWEIGRAIDWAKFQAGG